MRSSSADMVASAGCTVIKAEVRSVGAQGPEVRNEGVSARVK